MSSPRTTGSTQTRSPDPALVVLGHLVCAEGLPTLRDLAAGLIAACQELPRVTSVAVLGDPQGAGLLEPARGRSAQARLGEWSRHGELPVGSLERTLSASGRPAVTVRLGLDCPAAQAEEARQALDGLLPVLEAVAALWAQAVAAGAQRRQAETQVQALDRLNRLQGRFLALASHELKTPLTSIMAYADVLQQGGEAAAPPRAAEFLGVIQSEAARLLRMVNGMLDLSRMEFGQTLPDRQPCDLAALVRETVRTLQPQLSAKGQTCAVTAEPGLPAAMVDGDLIRQVLVNLIGNAAKYTPAGGRIAVTLTEAAAMVEVRVADTGPGISVEDARRVFREFFRASRTAAAEEGSGLGLSIARRIVQLHGGSIGVAPGPDGGSVFAFRVPKEAVLFAAPPAGLAGDGSAAAAVAEALVRLLAELSGSRLAVLLLDVGTGRWAPAAALGLEPGVAAPHLPARAAAASALLRADHPRSPAELPAADPLRALGRMSPGEELLLAPLAGIPGGCLVLGRRLAAGSYGEDEREQIGILARIVRQALASLVAGVPGARIVEGLRLLEKIRATGVPTATAEALRLVAALGRRLGLGAGRIRGLQLAAALHDAGMARLEDEILLGETDLSWDERDEVDRHVEQGVELMGPLLADPEAAGIIRHHHERWDGNGYPDGLAGVEIPLGARLLAVIDAWYSLTCGRPYRDGLAPRQALQEIGDHAGTQFDARVVAEFTELLRSEGLV